MTIEKIGITKARIKGLSYEARVFVSGHKVCMKIRLLTDTTTAPFMELPYVRLGKTGKDSEQHRYEIFQRFNSLGIRDGDDVAVLFREQDGSVLAIGAVGANQWLDVYDDFAIREFAELNIIVQALSVY